MQSVFENSDREMCNPLPLMHSSLNFLLYRPINYILLWSQLQTVNRFLKRVLKAKGKKKCVWLERKGKAQGGQ